MNADDIDPSAKSSLRRFGILKATKKTSEVPVAPKYLARIMSLMYPSTRLTRVAADIAPAAFAILPFALKIRDSPDAEMLYYIRV